MFFLSNVEQFAHQTEGVGESCVFKSSSVLLNVNKVTFLLYIFIKTGMQTILFYFDVYTDDGCVDRW